MAADAGTSREPMVAVDSTHITADRSAPGAKRGPHRHRAPGTKGSVTEPASGSSGAGQRQPHDHDIGNGLEWLPRAFRCFEARERSVPPEVDFIAI